MSKNYAIARIKKYSHVSQAHYLVSHHLRLVTVHNADPTKAVKNKILVQKDVEKFLMDVPKGSKRNACRFVDCLFTASTFLTKQQRTDWMSETMKFVEREVGRENIALAVLHMDETTPHIHVIFKPVNPKTKKLGAGYWFDGRMKMKAYQDRYYRAVEKLGFDRGDPTRRAKHTTLKQHYTEVNKTTEAAELEMKKFKESLEAVKKVAENFTLVDLFKPATVAKKLTPCIQDLWTTGKTVMQYQAYNRLEKKQETSKKLAAENEALRQKLEALTGSTNPDWLMIEKMSLTAPPTSGGVAMGGKTTTPDPYLEMMPTPPPVKPTPKTQALR